MADDKKVQSKNSNQNTRLYTIQTAPDDPEVICDPLVANEDVIGPQNRKNKQKSDRAGEAACEAHNIPEDQIK